MHISAQRRHILAQFIIIALPFAMVSHMLAQAVQISAHIWHIFMDISELRIMKSEHIWHICAQSIIIFNILESQAPLSRQLISISVQQR
jgi:hypothetical protein